MEFRMIWLSLYHSISQFYDNTKLHVQPSPKITPEGLIQQVTINLDEVSTWSLLTSLNALKDDFIQVNCLLGDFKPV